MNLTSRQTGLLTLLGFLAACSGSVGGSALTHSAPATPDASVHTDASGATVATSTPTSGPTSCSALATCCVTLGPSEAGQCASVIGAGNQGDCASLLTAFQNNGGCSPMSTFSTGTVATSGIGSSSGVTIGSGTVSGGSSTRTGDRGPDAGGDDACTGSHCANGCVIGGDVYASGAVNPNDVCQVCIPGTSTTAWTDGPDGTTCGSTSVCNAGACTAGCFINGAFQATGAPDPTNACDACQPETSTTAWSSVSDGTTCGTGRVCVAGSCGAGCVIDDAAYSSGQANPDNACQTCKPDTSTEAWSSVSNGTSCGSGHVCTGGVCSGGTGAMCPSTCSMNSQCASGCPVISGALNCCDSVTMRCFQSAATECPSSTPPDAGMTGY